MAGGCAQPPAAGSAGRSTLASRDTLTSDPQTTTQKNAAAKVSGQPGQTVAFVNDKPISTEQLQKPLFEAYGLNLLLHLAQIELCKQWAQAAGVKVTAEDIAAERQRTLEQMFQDAVNIDQLKVSEEEKQQFRQKEYERLLEQFLQAQRVSRPEFEMAMETGAYLRKLAEPGLAEKITEQHLKDGFNIMYGEKVRVRHIQLSNMQEVAEAQRRLRGGEAFDVVAAEMSRDPRSRNRGGELERPFSRAEPLWPQAFKDAAFELKNPGDLSDPVHTGDAIHLIKLEQKIAPRGVTFEDHKDAVRKELYDGLLLVRIRQLREDIAQQTRDALRIQEPILKKQYQERLAQINGQTTRDANEVRREIESDRPAPPTTQPGANDAVLREGRRPPATMPGQ
jgi:parvulin-like peptidyl-prolyl isomerase